MAEKKTNLDNLAAQKQKLLEELRKIEEQENKERQAEAESAYGNIVNLLEEFSKFFDSRQRTEIARFVGARKSVSKKSTDKVPVAAKYKLPNGETWSGRGRTPTAFVEWEKSDAAKKWRDANPEQKWPAA
ncbi:H-NS histone family protein [Stenotrophomonas maltophilia]|nr:H-NS histone family protein [Stenotrophomonas maltophilia]